MRENVYGIHLHQGPAFERWRRGMAASVGAVMIDNKMEADDAAST